MTLGRRRRLKFLLPTCLPRGGSPACPVGALLLCRVRAAHDVSDGGLAVAIAEMCLASGLGASVSISRDSYPDSIFSPLATTYVLEMPETAASESGQEVIGRVEKEPRLCIAGGDVERIDVAVADLARAWRSPLAHGGGR